MTLLPRVLVAAATCVLSPLPASAQEAPAAVSAPHVFSAVAVTRALGSMSAAPVDPPGADGSGSGGEEGRRCPGCPVRRLVRPYVESLALDVMYNGINHLRGHHTARVGFKSWWQNLRHGFEWDDNPWGVNQIGHPYQGSNYFTSGRAHGLTFWESTAVAAFGSSTWEFLAENNRASLNDFINTTLGGIALGEVMHRVGWLVRNPTITGSTRKRQELLATAIDPMGGLQRFMSGDARRVAPRPPWLIPSSVSYGMSAGVLWQGASLRDRAMAQPFVEIAMDYGHVRSGADHMPFSAFELAFQSRGGSPIAELALRGRLLGRPFRSDKRAQFSVFQTFDYVRNRAYAFGGQGVEAEVALTTAFASTGMLRMSAAGGATVLGAVDTLVDPPPGARLDPALLARRTYDYGPTFRFGGTMELQRAGTALARLAYQGYQLNVVDGTRSFHVLQRLNLDLRMPLRRHLSLGVAGEYFFRKAYFWPTGNRTDQSPQFRVFATWRRP